MTHLKRTSGIILAILMVCLAGSVLSAYAATTRSTSKGVLPMAVQKAIDEKKERLGASYTPRTRHLNEDGSAQFTNRLFLEESPYLLQHAHNPVNWHPWGEEAFALARDKNLPLLVSIGYATCHWCHVMEEESFEDIEIADYLNTHFVAIKVDREERPDIDGVYMGAVQMLTGSGGWPLNAFLTPEGKPFYGGTYFPARDGDRPPHTGFLTLLARITELYKTDKDKIEDSAARLTSALQQLGQKRTNGETLPSLEWVTRAISGYGALYDPSNGGTKGAPKFPSTLPVSLFLRQYKKSGNIAYRQMAEHSLTAMADGGIHDQVGGGFHRYSTDAKWLVPHFEKMLYDNALLATLYLEGFLATGNPRFETVTRTTLDYLLKEMESPEGGFYSATDADTLTPSGHKEEGYFFTWSAQELEEALPHKNWEPVYDLYNLSDKPHFEGRIIPHRTQATEAVAKKHGLTTGVLNAKVHEANDILYEARKTRVAPFTDKKIIAAWNGLTLSALAKAGRHLNDPRYLESAEKTARFIVEELMEKGRLHRSKLEGIGPKGFIDDYTFVTQGLLDLFEATGDETWLKRAMELQAKATQLFGAKDGGFYMTGNDAPALIARERPGHDGALPSGNGIAAMNLFRLYALTTDTTYLTEATATVSAFVSSSKDPGPFSSLVGALDFHQSNPETLVLVLPDGQPDQAILEALHAINTDYTPYAVTVVVHESSTNNHTLGITKGKKAMEGKPTLYPCQNGTCSKPIVNPTAKEPPAAR